MAKREGSSKIKTKRRTTEVMSATKKKRLKPGPSRSPAAKRTQHAPAAPKRPASLDVGIHADVPYLRYQLDPAPAPSLSASFIKEVAASSPAHAWLTHPRLNPNYTPRPATKEMDFGSAAHALLLGSQELSIIKYPDWKTSEARAFRERAKAEGQCPVLVRDYPRIAGMRDKLMKELASTELAGVFEEKRGLNECVAIWKDDGYYFRARADRWIPPLAMARWRDGLIVDYKTTWDSASPERWSGTCFNIGSDFQSALYPHGFALALNQSGQGRHSEGGLAKLPAFRFIVQECEEPFEFQIFGPSQVTMDHTTNKIVTAFALIRQGFAEKTPPGYSRQTAFFDPPAWELRREQNAALARLATA